jgi:hypothetical protein
MDGNADTRKRLASLLDEVAVIAASEPRLRIVRATHRPGRSHTVQVLTEILSTSRQAHETLAQRVQDTDQCGFAKVGIE